ncbi:hypothetical protein Tco_0694615 [Tanacetum coccineum]
MAELTSKEYIVNAQNKSNLSITSNDIDIELNKEFLVKLRKNAYHGWIDEDVVNHIAKVLEMVDLIYVPGPRERNIDEYWWRIYKSGDLEVLES